MRVLTFNCYTTRERLCGVGDGGGEGGGGCLLGGVMSRWPVVCVLPVATHLASGTCGMYSVASGLCCYVLVCSVGYCVCCVVGIVCIVFLHGYCLVLQCGCFLVLHRVLCVLCCHYCAQCWVMGSCYIVGVA